MDTIQTRLNEKGDGAFYIMDGESLVAEMIINISGNDLTVFHTEVSPAASGRGLGKKLLEYMAAYAREHGLLVTPLCPFVHAQFKRHPEAYADLWKQGSRSEN